MGGGIDWLMLAITVPLVPTLAIVGALFWMRTVRPKPDDWQGIYLAAEPEDVNADADYTGSMERPAFDSEGDGRSLVFREVGRRRSP
jgi:hypothetical protein